MKALGRMTQKKVNCEIVLTVLKIGAQVENDCRCKLVWKRGPQLDESELYELNNLETDVEAMYMFSRVSSFYTSDNRTYTKKTCDFQFVTIDDKDDKEKIIATIEGYDMAPFVNQIETKQMIKFKNSEVPGTFIEVSWTIQPTTEKKTDLKTEQQLATAGHRFSVQGRQYTADEVQDFLDEKEELEAELKNID